MGLFDQAAKNAGQKSLEYNGAVLVAFSGGKDSLAVLDLCRRSFARVECVFKAFVPNMRYTRERVTDVCDRLGVPCHVVPDPIALAALKAGVFCDPGLWRDLDAPAENDVFKPLLTERGITLLATGKKEADFRQRAFHLKRGNVFGWHPLQRWRKKHVLDYLALHGIDPPPTFCEAGGIDLTAASLCHLHDHWPDDFARVLRYFPYAKAVTERRRLYPDVAAAAGGP